MYRRQIIIGLVIVALALAGLIYYLTRPTTLNLTSDPANIDVYIGPNNKVSTPVTVEVEPGNYRIWGEKTGYNLYYSTFEAKKHRQNNLKITLTVAEEPSEGSSMEPAPTPAIKNLPYSNDHFRVEWNDQEFKYLVVPKVPFSFDQAPEAQIKANWSDYQKYAQEALSWMRSQGAKPTNDNIEWWAQEWWPQGAKVNI